MTAPERPDQGTASPELDRLRPSVQGLARALFRHAPQPDWTAATHRARYEEAAAGRPVADAVRVEPVDLAGVAGEWLLPAEPRSEQVIAYLHGGGFIMGSLRTTRPLASQLACATGRRVIVIDYPLAPESAFPDQLTAIVSALRELGRSGHAPRGVVLAGDSAGGALALSTARMLVGNAGPDIAALVMLSPLLDLRLGASSIDANAGCDPQVPRWLLERMAAAYRGPYDPEDPMVSAVLGPLDRLPPMLVQASPDEALADDARLLTECARQAGVRVDLQWWDGMLHVWHAFAPRLPEANEALNAVGDFVDCTDE